MEYDLEVYLQKKLCIVFESDRINVAFGCLGLALMNHLCLVGL